jgi:general secretion pathway protein J
MSNTIADFGLRISDFGSSANAVGFNSQSAIRNPKSRGFTLLEVLLALTILAVVMTTIYSSFSTAGKNMESAGEVRDGTDRARTLIARLTNDIANTYIGVVNGTVSYGIYGKKFETDQEKQRFDSIYLTTLTNYYGRTPNSPEMELCEVGYFFQERPDGAGRVLMRKEKRVLSKDVPPREGGLDYEITDTIQALQFRYYNGSKWIDEWIQGGMPKTVEILLTLADGRVYETKVDVGYQ